MVVPFSFDAGSDNPKDDCQSIQCPHGDACFRGSRFEKEGPSIPHKVVEHEDALYMRLDMPGIGENEVKVWVQDNTIHVYGEEKVAKDYVRIYHPRKYCGDFKIRQGCYSQGAITAEFKHGVLKIKVPKRKRSIIVNANSPGNEISPCNVNAERQKKIDVEELLLGLSLLCCGSVFGFCIGALLSLPKL